MSGRNKPRRGPRGPYDKPPVKVPAPDWAPPEIPAPAWIRQEAAAEICGVSLAQASRWAHGRARVDPRSLQLLQLHAFGAVVPVSWRRRGVFFLGDALRTEAGRDLSAGEIAGYAWLRERYQLALAELEAREAASKAASVPAVPLAEIIPIDELRQARAARQRPAGGPETKSPA